MSSEFEVRQRFEPPRTELPSYPKGDFEDRQAHYKAIATQIMGVIPVFPQCITLEGLVSIITGSSTPIREISGGDIRYVLDEHLLGNSVECKQVNGMPRYSIKQ